MQAAYLWKKLFSKKHLSEHYIEKIRNKPSIGLDKVSPQKFEDSLDENIDVIIRKTGNSSYKFTRYKQLLFTKGPTKPPRAVCVPTMRDKLTESVINELMEGIYGDSCKTKLPQIVIDEITNDIRLYDCYIKLDVKSFYGSINHELLLKVIKKKIRKPEIVALIENAIKTEAIAYPIKDKMPRSERELGIPEGLPFSNSLANIFMSDIDNKYRNNNSISYHRYVDDILILVNKQDFTDIRDSIVADIKALKLELNEKRDEGAIASSFEYLGYSISDSIISVRRSSVLKIEQSIEELIAGMKGKNIPYLEWKLNLKITGFILEEHKYGWLFFYSQITDMNLLFHLDDVVNKLLGRYKIKGKVRVKRFVRTFHEMHLALHETKYIPNLDELQMDQKKQLLSEIYGMDLAEKDDKYIEIQFRRIMKREIRDIEKDVQNIS